MSEETPETWNKAGDLRAKRKAARAAATPPRLQPPYPWPGIPLDPTLFGEVVVQSIGDGGAEGAAD